jgi:hypothetical protein
MQFSQRLHLLLGKPPHSTGHLKLRGEITTEYNPLAPGFARRKFTNQRLLVTDAEARPQLLASFAKPVSLNYFLSLFSRQPHKRFVLRKVTGQALGGGCGRANDYRDKDSNQSHRSSVEHVVAFDCTSMSGDGKLGGDPVVSTRAHRRLLTKVTKIANLQQRRGCLAIFDQ